MGKRFIFIKLFIEYIMVVIMVRDSCYYVWFLVLGFDGFGFGWGEEEEGSRVGVLRNGGSW